MWLLQNLDIGYSILCARIWLCKGIETNAYYLKLCGSGGGGFILGFTEDYEKAEKALKDYPLEVVYRF